MADTPARFDGFGEKALPFLKALGFHQSRDWFQDNKALYESDVKRPLGDLVEAVAARCAERGIPITGSRKTSLFRVNRDVRFAKEKHPYNTHASAVLTRTGTKKDNGFLYVHVSNEESFVGTGFYGLESAELAAFRRQIIDRWAEFTAITDRIAKAGHTLQINPETSLKRNPRGFETVDAPEQQQIIRMKNQIFTQPVDNSEVTTPRLADIMVELADLTLPVLDFGWRAIDPVRQAREDKKTASGA